MDDEDAPVDDTVMLTRRARRARIADAGATVLRSPEVVSRPGEEDLADTVPAPPRRREEAEAAPAIYKPRPAPLVPSRPPVVVGSEVPTRDPDAVLASVVRRSRRASVRALVAVGAACVVSVAGLVGLGFVLLG